MSYKKYMNPDRRTKLPKKKGHAIFPDGDESDASSNATYYNIHRHSSSSTSFSEQSSGDSMGAKGFKFEDGDDDVFIRLNSLSTDDSECQIRTKRTTTTISSIDINIFSPERSDSSSVRHSCSTRTTESADLVLSSDEIPNEISGRGADFQRDIHNKSPFLSINPTLVPCIDVISPSPTLSVFSERLVIKQQRTDLLGRPSVILSPISSRTMTPRSSLSSNSTISDNIHEVYSLEKSYAEIRDQLLQRRNVLPPIIRAPEDKHADSKKKRKTKTKKSKIKVYEECSTRSSSAARIKIPRPGRKPKKTDQNTVFPNTGIFNSHFNNNWDQTDIKVPFKNDGSKQYSKFVKKERKRRTRKPVKEECNSLQIPSRRSHKPQPATNIPDHSPIVSGSTKKTGSKKNCTGIQNQNNDAAQNVERSSKCHGGDDVVYKLCKSEETRETQSKKEIKNFSVTKKCLSPRGNQVQIGHKKKGSDSKYHDVFP